jgi:hypothetical protein
MLRGFRQKCTLEDVIDSHACSLARLKLLHACDQWHSCWVFTPLTGWHCKLRPNTEGKAVRERRRLEPTCRHLFRSARHTGAARWHGALVSLATTHPWQPSTLSNQYLTSHLWQPASTVLVFRQDFYTPRGIMTQFTVLLGMNPGMHVIRMRASRGFTLLPLPPYAMPQH